MSSAMSSVSGAAAFAGGGFAAGAVSAATGALAAKAFSDRSERWAIDERLHEVKRSSPRMKEEKKQIKIKESKEIQGRHLI